MAKAKKGDTVRVQYKGTLDDGTIFDESMDSEPLEFKIGEEELIPGFEDAVIGMEPGDTKTEKIAAAEAYGLHEEEMILEVDRSAMPTDPEPQVGDELNVEQDDGTTFPVIVLDVNEDKVKLDANHPLAGEDLTFEIKLLEIL